MDIIKINFDALKKDSWSETETANARLITDFIQNLMNNHDLDYVKEHFMNSKYKQHNRNLPEGMAGLIKYIEGFVKRYPEYTYDVKHIFADGDYVIFHSHSTLKKKDRGNDKKGLNIIDYWRIEDGQIVEHWDAIQPIDGFMRFFIWLTGGNIRNSNGVF